MTSYLIIDKMGNINEKKYKKKFVIDDLYKKCGFRKNNGFNNIHTWNVDINSNKYIIKLFGKKEGKSNYENKYDFPPPIDKLLLFGNCCLICYNNDEIISLTTSLWNTIYNKLFNGFDDIINDKLSDDELDYISDDLKTNDGYLKDGFIIDSSDEECFNGESITNKNIINENITNELVTSELSEEEYEYDDNYN